MSADTLSRFEAVEDRIRGPLRWARWAVSERLHRDCQEQSRLAFRVGRDCERDSLGLPTQNYSGYFALTDDQASS